MQISFNVEIKTKIDYALTYQILLHFERSTSAYTKKKIVDMVVERTQKIEIEYGNNLKPIALLCLYRDNKL